MWAARQPGRQGQGRAAPGVLARRPRHLHHTISPQTPAVLTQVSHTACSVVTTATHPRAPPHLGAGTGEGGGGSGHSGQVNTRGDVLLQTYLLFHSLFTHSSFRVSISSPLFTHSSPRTGNHIIDICIFHTCALDRDTYFTLN